ncbi:MAG: metallophosphoesterase [Thainema sp.]
MHRLLTGPLTVEHVDLEIEGLPQSLQQLKIVQLTDLHFDGLRLSTHMLKTAIAQSNAVQPDLVVLTGDYVTDDPAPIHKLADWLSHLQSRYGTYAVLGNHDIVPCGAQQTVTAAFENAGIRVLWNEVAYPFGPEFPVVGLADYWSRDFDPAITLDTIPLEIPRLVLSHNPDTAEHLRAWRVDLQLSGHTHGGQIRIPGLGIVPTWAQTIRPHIPKRIRRYIPYMRGKCVKVVRHWEWAQGLHQVGSNWLYVNRGLGTFPPGRLLCPPELTVITLSPSVRQESTWHVPQSVLVAQPQPTEVVS